VGRIITQAIPFRIPFTDLPGQRQQSKGFRLRVRNAKGDLAEVYHLRDRPRLMYLRGAIPEGCAAELDQAVYLVGKRRVYVTIAQYFNLSGDAVATVLERFVKAKGPSINTPEGVDGFVDSLAADLLKATEEKNEAGLRAALRTIEKNKNMITAEEHARLAKLIANNWANAVAGIENTTGYVIALQDGGMAAVAAARQATIEEYGWEKAISFAPNLSDESAIIEMAGNRGFFVKDAYGLREGRTARKAQSIMSGMLKQGLGREEMAVALQDQLGDYMKREDLNYWTTVADNHITRTRSWGNLSSMADAGLWTFTVEAVLDEATTDICRFMHGKEISIPQTQSLMLNADAAPRHMDKVNPFMRSKGGPGGTTILQVPHWKGNKQTFKTVATAKETGFGIPNATGKWNTKIGGADMPANGIGAPPYHHRCRSTLIPTGGQIPTQVPRPRGPKKPPKPKPKNPRVKPPPPPPPPPPPEVKPAEAPKPAEPYHSAFKHEAPNTHGMRWDEAEETMLAHWDARLPDEKADWASFVADAKGLEPGNRSDFKKLAHKFVSETGKGTTKGAWGKPGTTQGHRFAKGTTNVKRDARPEIEGKKTTTKPMHPVRLADGTVKYPKEVREADKIMREVNSWVDADTIAERGIQRAAGDKLLAESWHPENQRLTLWWSKRQGVGGFYAGSHAPKLYDRSLSRGMRVKRRQHLAMKAWSDRHGGEEAWERYQYDLAHECGHVLQEMNPNANHLGRAIMSRKIKATGARKTWNPNGEYWYYPETRSVINYTSATYDGWPPGVEYPSEGMAQFWKNPMELYEADPEHFFYITSLLRGGI